MKRYHWYDEPFSGHLFKYHRGARRAARRMIYHRVRKEGCLLWQERAFITKTMLGRMALLSSMLSAVAHITLLNGT